MKTFFYFLIAGIGSAIVLSCSGNGSEIAAIGGTGHNGPGTTMIEGNILKSTVDRDTASAPDSDIAIVAEANNAFAWAMFIKLFDKNTNMVFSPYSLSTALSMTWIGARNETATEMQQALQLPFGGARFHAAANFISRQLQSRGQSSSLSLNAANFLWGEQTAQFSVNFLDTLARYYDAGMGLCDFINNPESERSRINSWISGKTDNMMPDMLSPGAIDNSTRLVITNTLFFDAAWADTFQHKFNRKGNFYPSSSDTIRACFMWREDTCNYSGNDDFQAIEIPYSGKQLSMVVLLPKNRQFPILESALGNAIVKTLLEKLAPAEVEIEIPKFSFALGARSIKRQLIALGIQHAFTDQADFSGITTTLPLKIGDVVHDAFIAMDEKGTTVTAATTGVAVCTGMPEIIFNADHPFIFLIRDIPTNQILFIGYVSAPTTAEQ